MKRRKRSDDNPKPGSSCCSGMSLAGACFVGQMGVRRRGGASSVQAPVWNVGTPRLDVAGMRVDADGVRENPKQLTLQGRKYRCEAGGRTAFVVARNAL